ncbi:MAG: AAA family ATPase, partial [Candidatus Methanomethylophilaceae archaeon]
MSERYYPDGVYDFKALVTGNYLFVDKTLMIKDICNLKNKTLLFTRPRRFGKSINLSMMDYFFNIRYRDDENIFKDLKISKCDQCSAHRNAYPVIRMNF